MFIRSLILLLPLILSPIALAADPAFAPGERALFEAHNCYPYNGWWTDRIDRALKMPRPVAIELDMRWHEGKLIVAHDAPRGAAPPTLKEYAFDKIRPVVEAALQSGDRSAWPIITLNLNDLRGSEPGMYAALGQLAVEHRDWLCSAPKGEDPSVVVPMSPGPVLLLTNGGRLAQKTFHDDVPNGHPLLLFGCGDADTPPTNFLRWINYSWSAVEPEGQTKAGTWTPDDAARLTSLVTNAHQKGYWIRFYALNGHSPVAVVQQGLSPAYNFGSLDAARIRWQAAREAGVDFIATDQYEDARP